MPDKVAAEIERRTSLPGTSRLEDPEGVISAGLVLTSPTDPTHRRLVTNLYTTARGKSIVSVHIEGETGLRNLSLEDIHQRIDDGQVELPPAPAE